MILKINQMTNRVRRAIWKYRQPLTRVPEAPGATVSDLFIWRNSSEWETFFEAIDMPSLFDVYDGVEHKAQIFFFDKLGNAVFDTTLVLIPNRRKTISLSEMIHSGHGDIGTFCVFHSHNPKSLSRIGAYLAERGYLSFRYKGAPLRSYVHGNLDAIAFTPEQGLQLLGGRSILSRQYCLQYCLSAPDTYDMALVNPTSIGQKIICKSLSLSGDLLDSQVVCLPPRGCHIFRIIPKFAQQRVVFSSSLVMGRPVIFKVSGQKMDVFHG